MTSFLCICKSIFEFLLKHNIPQIILIIGFIILLYKKKNIITEKAAQVNNFCSDLCRIIFWGLVCNFRLLWFICLTTRVAMYCKKHWGSVIILKPLTGDSILFFLLIFLLIYPLVSNIKVSGVEGNFYNLFESTTAKDNFNKALNKLTQNTKVKDQIEKDQAKLSELLNILKEDLGGTGV